MPILTSVTPDDVATQLGRDSLSSVERAQITSWIAEAVYLIGRRTDATADQDAVDYVVRQAVLAVADAPAPGVVQESVQVDDGSVTTRYGKAARRVTILPEWWEMLGVVDGKTAAFSIDMTGGATAVHQPWCTVNLGGTYCSCGADLAGYPLYEW